MVVKVIKSPFSIFLLMIMFIMFLLSHNFCNPTRREIVKTRQLKVEPDTGSKRLLQLLRKTTMADRKVIVSMVGEEWASSGSILDLFLESFHIGQDTKPLLDHLLLVALDSKAFHYCNSIHPHCFLLTNPPTKYTSKKPLPLHQLKFAFFRQLIELGYNFIFTEADIMWLRNPVTQFNPLNDLAIACDVPSLDKVDQLFFMKSNEFAFQYFKYWNVARVLFLNSQNQSLCEATVNDQDIFQALGLKLGYLDVAHFSGFCQQRKDMKVIHTMRADCCENIEHKVHDLRLFLDDWRNFTALSAENTSLNGSFFTWRAPDKCKVMNRSS